MKTQVLTSKFFIDIIPSFTVNKTRYCYMNGCIYYVATSHRLNCYDINSGKCYSFQDVFTDYIKIENDQLLYTDILDNNQIKSLNIQDTKCLKWIRWKRKIKMKTQVLTSKFFSDIIPSLTVKKTRNCYNPCYMRDIAVFFLYLVTIKHLLCRWTPFRL